MRPRVFPDLELAPGLVAERGGRLGRPLRMVAETESTNDDAKFGAKDGEPHGATWLAEVQTRGRGRQGRVWVAEAGESLLFSVLCRIACAPARVPPLAIVAGLAVRDAVARAVGSDDDVLVKWPNDVVIRRKDGRPGFRKVAGVLVESQIRGTKVEHVVVGVGLNVHARAFPDELRDIATSCAIESSARDAGGSRPPPDRSTLLADILAGLDHDLEHVAFKGLGLVHGRLTRHDALAGLAVRAADDGWRGVAEGIDLDGKLRVRRDDGVVSHVGAGEVTLA